MGQYYNPVNIDKMEFLYSHHFDNGLKLMEHSYLGNNFVEAIERLLSPNGSWHKCRICWAGDYMMNGLFLPEPTPKNKEGDDHNLHSYVDHYGKNALPDIQKVLEALEKDGKSIENYDIMKKTSEELVKKWLPTLPKKGRYLVNHTKEVCLDLQKETSNEKWDDGTPIIIHPLPLLTAEGNGQGGGDYHGSNMALVGSWAGDVISLEYEPMYTLNKPINFREGNASEGTYKFVTKEPKKPRKTAKPPETKVEMVVSAEDENVIDLLG